MSRFPVIDGSDGDFTMVTESLRGVRVLDLTRLLPGGFCTSLLADLGADVVKLEDPERGDYLREISPGLFSALNHRKRSLVLDLKQPAARTAFFRVILRFDVLIESFRPGVLERLGCGYRQIKTLHPALIFCALTGYGQAGPLAKRSGHDLNYLSVAGLLSDRDRPPAVPFADYCGGYAAAFQIVAALQGRNRHARGCFLDLSLTEAVRPMVIARSLRAIDGRYACYNLYRTSDDRQFSLAAIEPKFFRAFTEAIGRPELADAQFDRSAQNRLKAALEEMFAQRTQDDWEQLFATIDSCGAPVLVPQQEQEPAPANCRPARGQHSAEILREAGLTDGEIVQLGVVEASLRF